VNEPYRIVPLSPIRKMIAARTAAATQTVPHFRLRADLDMEGILTVLHARSQGTTAGGRHPSINDMLVKLCAEALQETPALNIQWVEGELRRLERVDIAVVVALDEGISTPILRDAGRKSLVAISDEMRELGRRARAQTLRMEELMGGSFSVSNLGMYGVAEFDAIINPPQCAILAVGAAHRAVVPGNDREVRVTSVARVTLSCDHRAVDGAVGASFLCALKRRAEDHRHLETLVSAS
jgi:pyruvate dehydrogenase E2 component (dihydrolipoamide acetyltransferase)